MKGKLKLDLTEKNFYPRKDIIENDNIIYRLRENIIRKSVSRIYTKTLKTQRQGEKNNPITSQTKDMRQETYLSDGNISRKIGMRRN